MQRVVVIGVTGSGKTTFARRLSVILDAPHVEIDALNWQSRFIVWPRADTIVWLDVPFRTAFARLIRRTVGRVRTGETLWGTDNRETLGRTLFSKDSILWWQLTTFRPKRRAYPGLLSDPAIAHVVSHRLRSASEAEAFLEAADSD